jgi:hypothetical protein
MFIELPPLLLTFFILPFPAHSGFAANAKLEINNVKARSKYNAFP